MSPSPFEQKIQKKVAKGKTKQLLPIIKQFNSIAHIFIRSLTQKLEREEAQLSKIKVMVSGIKIPESTRNYTINIQTMDMNKTIIKKKGNSGYNQVMEWEKNLKKQSRGMIL